jgi:hypothetical protein
MNQRPARAADSMLLLRGFSIFPFCLFMPRVCFPGFCVGVGNVVIPGIVFGDEAEIGSWRFE